MLTVGHVYVLRDVFVTHQFMLMHDFVASFVPYRFAFAGAHNDALLLWRAEEGSRRQPAAFARPSPSSRPSTSPAAVLTSTTGNPVKRNYEAAGRVTSWLCSSVPSLCFAFMACSLKGYFWPRCAIAGFCPQRTMFQANHRTPGTPARTRSAAWSQLNQTGIRS